MQNDWKLNIYNKRYYYLKFVTKTVGLCAVTLASKLHFTFPLFVRPTKAKTWQEPNGGNSFRKAKIWPGQLECKMTPNAKWLMLKYKMVNKLSVRGKMESLTTKIRIIYLFA